jgi:hypothetical protein
MSRDDSPLVRDVSPDEGYTYMHRAFLHAFLTHSVLTADEIKPVLAHVMTAHSKSTCIFLACHARLFCPYSHIVDHERPWTSGDVTQPHVTSTIQTINARIEHYDFEIRSLKDQHTKLTVYALVNKTSDSLTQLATRFSASEIAYIRRLLDYMFETNNTRSREVMAIKHTEASQLARVSRRNRQSQANGASVGADGETATAADTGISMPEADNVLDTLLSQSFLQQSPAQYYSLAPRALMELRAYLKETYNEPASSAGADDAIVRIRDCEGCREIVTHGVRCNDKECGVRWHDACANSYYRGRAAGGRGCPKCGTECGGDVYVGERADKVGVRSSTGGRRSTMQQEDEEDENEED